MSRSAANRPYVQLPRGRLVAMLLATAATGALAAFGVWVALDDHALGLLAPRATADGIRSALAPEHPAPGESTHGVAAPPAGPSFEQDVRPILERRCSACHGDTKQKAGLALTSRERLLAGGKHGPVIDAAAPAGSLLLRRIELDPEDDQHMPPVEEEQLEAEELAMLRRWILAGAPFDAPAPGDAPAAGDAPRASDAAAPAVVAKAQGAAQAAPSPTSTPKPAPAPAPGPDPAAIASLRAALVHVQAVSADSPGLWIDFAAVATSIDDARARELLAPLAPFAEDVALARSLVGDATLELVSGFPRLRRLDVRSTRIGERGVAVLANSSSLEELVLSQNALGDAALESLSKFPALKRLHAWKCGFSAEGLARLRSARPELTVEDGSAPDSTALEAETVVEFVKPAPASTPAPASAPASVSSLAPVNAKCPVSGAPVVAKYAVVHEGRVIGFCCPECPKQFWAEPEKFLGRLE